MGVRARWMGRGVSATGTGTPNCVAMRSFRPGARAPDRSRDLVKPARYRALAKRRPLHASTMASRSVALAHEVSARFAPKNDPETLELFASDVEWTVSVGFP